MRKLKNKTLVDVVIPAHNEEGNIQNILQDILSQKQSSYALRRIYVVSDGSTDNTVLRSRKVRSNKIIVTDEKNRIGKPKVLNKFFKEHNKVILVQFDADIRLRGKLVIERLVKSVLAGSDLVSGYHEPVKPKKLIDKIGYFGVNVWEGAKNSLGKSGERYWACGQIRAFSPRLLRRFKYPANLFSSEDTYMFYWVKKNNYSFAIEPSAIVMFKLPDNYLDYCRQMNRFLKIKQSMSLHYDKSLMDRYETMRLKDRLRSLIRNSLKSPVTAIFYLLIHGWTKLITNWYQEKKVWDISPTSKIL